MDFTRAPSWHGLSEREYAQDAEATFDAFGISEDARRGDAMLTVVFTDGRKVSIPVYIPPKGEPFDYKDGILHAEDKTARLFSFPNVSHWWSDAI